MSVSELIKTPYAYISALTANHTLGMVMLNTHQERDAIGDSKVQDTHDVGMHEASNRLSLVLKTIDLFMACSFFSKWSTVF